MATSRPRKDSDFHLWITAIVIWLQANMVARGFDAAFINDRLRPSYNDWDTCYGKYLNPKTRSPEVITNKIMARKALEPLASEAVIMIKGNTMTSDAEKLNLNIAIGKGGGGQEAPPPTTSPEFFAKVVQAPTPGRVTVGYKDFGKKLEGRPAHVNHMELEYAVLSDMTEDETLLTEHLISTTSPIVMDHPGKQRSMSLCLRGRWVSNAGKAGPWSLIVRFIIP
jgi:hypothetical protein